MKTHWGMQEKENETEKPGENDKSLNKLWQECQNDRGDRSTEQKNEK